jgi:stage III sporulation protein AA
MAVGDLEMREIFRRICGGAVFAHRDDVSRGFIALPCGIRVGVCGRARYEGGILTGVGDISSLVFRIPTGECSFGKELYSDWLKMRGGMLICSRAGEGKTTAIRSLARLIGSGERPLRVAVVDERCEFDLSEYVGSHVDILRGYRRSLGVDIAIRTMTAEVIVVDEISSREDSRALLSALGAGVSVIATAHADGLDSALRREYIREMVTEGLFESCCSIKRRGERFGYTIEKISDKTEISSHAMGVI